MRVNCLLIIICSICLHTGVSRGQEIQIKMDADGILNSIDRSLEQRLQLFPEYEGFREARLYQVSDSTFVLEVFIERIDGVLKERISLSLQEKDDFQQKVSRLYSEEIAQRPSAEKPKPRLDHSGRAELLIGTFGLSTGFYSWALPVVFGMEDGKLAVTTGLLASAGSFYIPYSTTKNVSVTEGMSAMSLWGGTRGILHGIALGYLVAGEDISGRGIIGMGMAFSIGEAVAGYKIASKYSLGAGQAREINFLGDMGVYWSLGIGQLFRMYDNNPERTFPLMGLLGTGAGLWVGTKLTNQAYYSKGDVHIQYTIQGLSAVVPIVILSLAESENVDLYITAMLASSYGGLRLGHKMISDKDFTVGQGMLIELGTSAGYCLGLALAYLFTPEDAETAKPYLTLGTLGAVGGFYFTYKAFSDIASETHEERSKLSFRLCPENILLQAMDKKLGKETDLYLPVFRLSYSF